MTDRAAAKRKERSNRDAGNVAVRGWICAEDCPAFEAMTERAKQALSQQAQERDSE